MKKLFLHIAALLILHTTPVLAQKLIWQIDKSNFVQLDSNYQLSLILSNTLSAYPSVNFYVFVDEGVNLVRSVLTTREFTKTLDVERVAYPGYYGKSYKITLPLSSDDEYLSANPRLLFELNAPYISITEVAFGLRLTNNEGEEVRVSSFEALDEFEYLPVTELNFYTDETKENRSLSLKPNNLLKLKPLSEEINNDLLYCFWSDLGSDKKLLISLFDDELQDTVIQIQSMNDGYLAVPAENIEANPENLFVGNSGWNHFAILFNSNRDRIDVLLNGELAYSISKVISSNTVINFSVKNIGETDVILDNLWVIDFGNGTRAVKRNMNYSRFISDTSRLMHSFDFESDLIVQNNPDAVLTFDAPDEAPELIDARPPLFSKVPEIVFQSFESFSEIMWRNSDDNSVESYYLEKSFDGSRYFEVLSKESEGDPDKYYSIIDEKNSRDEVVYYRIRQLNKDGSELYSAVLKVGQTVTESFLLEQNYPNPFNPATTITVEVLYDSEFDLVVYDLVGNKITQLHSGYLSEGIHKFEFDGTELPSGIYFMEASSQFSTQAIKMILAK